MINKYFDVVIDYKSSSYFIVEQNKKPQKKESALETLLKIELITDQNFTYNSSIQDNYSGKSDLELKGNLISISEKIRNGYHSKFSRKSALSKLFSRKKDIIVAKLKNNIVNKIFNLVGRPAENIKLKPADSLPLPAEVQAKIFGYLNTKDLGNLAKVNREARDHAEFALIKDARQYGFIGNDPKEATFYLQELCNEISELCGRGVIPKHYIVRNKNKKIDAIKTLENLKNISKGDLFEILDRDAIYEPSFTIFRSLFNRIIIGIPSSDSKAFLSHKVVESALLKAYRANETNIIKLLLHHGVDPSNVPETSDCYRPLLQMAARDGKKAVVEAVLECGYKDERGGPEGTTALLLACKNKTDNQLDIIKLLLSHGADINARGTNPIRAALARGNMEVYQLLKDHSEQLKMNAAS